MPIMVAIPREHADAFERKPPHGSPCNNCGACCLATLCEVGRGYFHQAVGPCPALLWRFGADGAKQSVCGLVALEDDPRRKAAILLLIWAGRGCDARFNGEPTDVEFHRTSKVWEWKHTLDLDRARKLLGIPSGYSVEPANAEDKND